MGGTVGDRLALIELMTGQLYCNSLSEGFDVLHHTLETATASSAEDALRRVAGRLHLSCTILTVFVMLPF